MCWRSAQAICKYRENKGIDGPLYIGIDTHALSQPAFESALEVLLEAGLKDVRRTPFEQARRAATTREHDFLDAYVADLGSVLDLNAIRSAGHLRDILREAQCIVDAALAEH
ncbi:MAG: hypothetical protein ACHBMF_05680 [Chromatiales bacterium]